MSRVSLQRSGQSHRHSAAWDVLQGQWVCSSVLTPQRVCITFTSKVNHKTKRLRCNQWHRTGSQCQHQTGSHFCLFLCRWCWRRLWWGHLARWPWRASRRRTYPDKVTATSSPIALRLALCWLFLSCVSVEFLEAVRQQVQKFQVLYIGNLPVSRAMGRPKCHLNTSKQWVMPDTTQHSYSYSSNLLAWCKTGCYSRTTQQQQA